MAKSPVQLQQLDAAVNKQYGSFVDLPKIDTPFTTIVNRAQMTDLSNDLLPRMGIERLIVQGLAEVVSETGPDLQKVWSALNDTHNQIRFVGAWVAETSDDGTRMLSGANSTDFVEVTFYGTGIAALTTRPSNRNVAWSIDGGSETLITAYDGTNSLGSRNYAVNAVAPLVSGLSLGLHTLRLRANASNALQLTGFQIFNESTSIKTTPGAAYLGSKKGNLLSLDTQSYNSSFASGVLGTRGGRVVMYMDSDGTIKKALTPTNSSQQNLTSANHTNEEVIQVYNFREFGAGRTDDFSTLAGAGGTFTDRAFTLEDGTTSLSANNVSADFAAGYEMIVTDTNANAGHITFTFVGTGLDLAGDFGGGAANIWAVTVDNSSIGNLSRNATRNGKMKVVSGLPYGTHTVKFTNNVGTANLCTAFVVYGPKKPTVPSEAVELADYFIMADYADNTATGTAVADNWGMPTGVLSKFISREFVFSGANWVMSSLDAISYPTGWTAGTSTSNNQPTDLTFFGTGVVLHLHASSVGTYDFSIAVDGVLNATGVNVSNISNLGAGSYRSTSTSSGAPARVKITGLTLGKHTIRLQRTAGTGNFNFSGYHLITPIHAVDSILPAVRQNSLPVGSIGIADVRPLAQTQDVDIPNHGQVVGVTTSGSTTSTSFVPLPDMVLTIKTTGRPVEIDWNVFLSNNTIAIGTAVQLYVDGLAVGYIHGINVSGAGAANEISGGHILPLGAGTHTIQLMWQVSSQTASLESNRRSLRAKEL
jgi:hypothetical protein